MKERRTCSKVKPWLYFSMELTIFAAVAYIVSKIVEFYLSPHYTLVTGLAVVTLLLYRTRAIQRLERVLERTEEVRKVKVRQRYEKFI